MKVLLTNPNRYKSPPVPPLGLEYISGPLEDKGHTKIPLFGKEGKGRFYDY
jgi:hypothetical protein